MTTKPHRKENLYFLLRVVFSLFGLYLISLGISALFSLTETSLIMTFVTFSIYILIFVFYFWLLQVFMIGHLRGNGIQITSSQFPEVFTMIEEASRILGIKNPPKVFLVQSGGVLNAFATRFAGKDYVAIYSDVFSTVESQPDVLKFILSHELAHVSRKHIQKRFWTLLSFYVPFLGSAYSRACEYTCDSFAAEVVPNGSINGLLLLAAGKDLYTKVNLEQYLATFDSNNSGAVKFTGVFASHPHLPKRIKYLANLSLSGASVTV